MSRRNGLSNLNGPRLTKRLLSLAVCVIILAGSLLSTAIIITYANHKHDHDHVHDNLGHGLECSVCEECAVCAQLTAAEKILKSLCAVLTGAAFAMVIAAAILSYSYHAERKAYIPTLVSLKVRLNN